MKQLKDDRSSGTQSNEAELASGTRVRVDSITADERSFNPWPWGIIAAFVVFISGTICLLVMACSQREDLVSGDYYDQEIKFQNQLDSQKRARGLGGTASVAYDAGSRRITILLPPDPSQGPISGRIELYRPSAAEQDRHFLLQTSPAGVQTLDAAGLARGLWKVRVFWKSQQQEYSLDQSVTI